MIMRFLIATLLICLGACSGNTSPGHLKLKQSNLSTLDDGGMICDYAYEKVETGFFTDRHDRPYQVTVSVDAVKNYQMRAEHVAELVSMMVLAHEQMGLPENAAVYDMLNRGHVVVIEDNITYYNWFADSVEETLNMDGAMIVIKPDIPCWDAPDTANWSILVHASYYNAASLDVLTHRLVHAVEVAMTGQRDNSHGDPNLFIDWDAPNRSTTDSLQARTYLWYEGVNGRCNRDAPRDAAPPDVTPQKRPYTDAGVF